MLGRGSWDAIVSSPLSRAKDTAEIVATALELGPVAIEPLLLERAFGEAEGMRHDEWKLAFPDQNLVRGCETLDELTMRAWRLLDRLAADYSGRRVLAVTHGALIRKLLKLVSKSEYPREGERLGNACLSIFEHSVDGWRVLSYEPKTLQPDI